MLTEGALMEEPAAFADTSFCQRRSYDVAALLVTRFWTIVGTILPLFLWVFSFQLVWFS